VARFILRYSASPAAPLAHMAQLRAAKGVKVVDESPNMLLVDGDEAALKARVAAMPGWSLSPEQTIPLPDTRRRIR
jgi:hypothetical protein